MNELLAKPGVNDIFVETIRIENGAVCNFELHRERMRRTAMHHFGTAPELVVDPLSMPPHLRDERVKCRVLYSYDIIATEFHAYRPKKIRSLRIVEDDEIEYEYKSADRNRLNELFGRRADADDIIIVRRGRVTDSSFANLVFATAAGELFTPKTYLLAGTKRASLLARGTIRERDVSVQDIASFSRVYLINAMMDISDDISVGVSSIV
ncbi:MAG: aminotransferase class IV [Rikenellaceae bacterium]|nr:aminotransferase class IV [Rikenellaceae bacterium]MCL2692411.1 aminotransferase class IV [Rikenellaceae bacterium]